MVLAWLLSVLLFLVLGFGIIIGGGYLSYYQIKPHLDNEVLSIIFGLCISLFIYSIGIMMYRIYKGHRFTRFTLLSFGFSVTYFIFVGLYLYLK